jgi:hypothetical protein
MDENRKIEEHFGEMTDDEWRIFYINKANMLAYRYARTMLSDIALEIDHRHYQAIEKALYNAKLNELWEQYSLPESEWPFGKSETD